MRDQDESDGGVPRPTQRGWSGDHPGPEGRTGSIVADRYRIGRMLGRGGMGEVYEAQHLLIGRRFAIKFVRNDLRLDERVMQRFVREAQAAGRLEHENIAAVFDLGSTPEGHPFIVLECLEGEDLARALSRGLPPPPFVAALVRQAALGLHAAHERGIVHRDLKPANLFVCKQPDGSSRIKVLDFGIAKLQTGNVGESMAGWMPTGTPQYMSPEQATGRRPADRRMDVYALGAILYEALSGRRPHAGADYQATLRAVMEGTPASLASLRPDLPAGMVEIVECAMSRDPEARFATAEAMANSLRPFAAISMIGLPVPASSGQGAALTPLMPVSSTPAAMSSPETRATDYTSGGGGGATPSEVQPAPRSWLPWAVAAVAAAVAAIVTALLVNSGRSTHADAAGAAVPANPVAAPAPTPVAKEPAPPPAPVVVPAPAPAPAPASAPELAPTPQNL